MSKPGVTLRTAQVQASEVVDRGIDLCRKGEWDQGLFFLGKVAETGGTMPGLFYSYLGYGIARCQNRLDEGFKLCQHSIKVEFYQPENYLNLARTCLLRHDRAGAVKAVRGGLKVDRNNPELLGLYRELGIRSLPVLPFLSRSNPLNRFLGGLRFAFRGEK